MCGRTSSTSKASSSTHNEDRRVAAQDSGVAISGGSGSVVVDMVPEEVLGFVTDFAAGADKLVTKSLNMVAENTKGALALSPAAVDAKTRAKPTDPVFLAAIVLIVAYFLMRAK